MNTKTRMIDARRRGFLRGSVMASGAAALAANLPAGATELAPAKIERIEDTSANYRETEHVRRYYDMARI